MANRIRTQNKSNRNLRFTGRSPRKNLIGCVFGRLTVVKFAGFTVKASLAHWECKCSCGEFATVCASNLINGIAQSCGCLHREKTGLLFRTHGMAHSSEYKCWSGMLQRCNNPQSKSYAAYGGRGIAVCDTWTESFLAFYADMGTKPSSRHSIDRIDNDGMYCKENCRWATYRQQQNNKRASRILTVDGVSCSMTEWANKVGMEPHTLLNRLNRGWPVAVAVNTPVKRRNK